MADKTAILYGIKNCDTCRKALAFLAEQGRAHEFHDYKKQGVPADRLPIWIAQCAPERLVNRKGMTWRKLEAAEQALLDDLTQQKAQDLLREKSSLLKRPLIEYDGQIHLGFDDTVRAALG